MIDTHGRRGCRRRVLIADDDAAIRSMLSLFLEQEGYEVETAENGVDALKRFEVRRFNLVMLAYYLPDIDGLQVASLIHGQDPDVTLVLMYAITG